MVGLRDHHFLRLAPHYLGPTICLVLIRTPSVNEQTTCLHSVSTEPIRIANCSMIQNLLYVPSQAYLVCNEEDEEEHKVYSLEQAGLAGEDNQ